MVAFPALKVVKIRKMYLVASFLLLSLVQEGACDAPLPSEITWEERITTTGIIMIDKGDNDDDDDNAVSGDRELLFQRTRA